MRYVLWSMACAGAVVAYVTLTRRTACSHLVGAVAIGSLFWAAVLAQAAWGGPYTPPTRAQGQRIAAAAYDRELRPMYPRSGIVTRCQGRTGRHLFCSVKVWRRGTLLSWQFTQLDMQAGRVHTSLNNQLGGRIVIPHDPHSVTYYESRPLR